MAYFAVDETVCATCSDWLGGRAIMQGVTNAANVKAFQVHGLCKANRNFVAAKFYCSSHEFFKDTD